MGIHPEIKDPEGLEEDAIGKTTESWIDYFDINRGNLLLVSSLFRLVQIILL